MSLRILFCGLTLIPIIHLLLRPLAEESLSTAVRISVCILNNWVKQNLQCVHHAILAISKIIDSLDAFSRNLDLALVVTFSSLRSRCIAEEWVFRCKERILLALVTNRYSIPGIGEDLNRLLNLFHGKALHRDAGVLLGSSFPRSESRFIGIGTKK